jgi:hypothetical protein
MFIDVRTDASGMKIADVAVGVFGKRSNRVTLGISSVIPGMSVVELCRLCGRMV